MIRNFFFKNILKLFLIDSLYFFAASPILLEVEKVNGGVSRFTGLPMKTITIPTDYDVKTDNINNLEYHYKNIKLTLPLMNSNQIRLLELYKLYTKFQFSSVTRHEPMNFYSVLTRYNNKEHSAMEFLWSDTFEFKDFPLIHSHLETCRPLYDIAFRVNNLGHINMQENMHDMLNLAIQERISEANLYLTYVFSGYDFSLISNFCINPLNLI